jgi:hypothetical protein
VTRTDLTLTRRRLLAAAGVATFTGTLGTHAGSVAVPLAAGGEAAPRFLDDHELETLRAVVDRVVPGPPEDATPGAVQARCAEAIDALLAAFLVSPPRIYAGAPFSDRGGASCNDFEDFLALDRYERQAWRRRITRPGTGYQDVYRAGLAAVDAAAGPAGPAGFATLPGPARDVVLRGSSDPAVTALVDVVVPHTLELMYGAPEYGGNHDLVGWEITSFEGDVQPRGWTREQVESPELDPTSALPLPFGVGTAAALGSAELVHGVLARSGGTYRGLRDEVGALTRTDGDAAEALGAIAARAAELVRAAEGRTR